MNIWKDRLIITDLQLGINKHNLACNEVELLKNEILCLIIISNCINRWCKNKQFCKRLKSKDFKIGVEKDLSRFYYHSALEEVCIVNNKCYKVYTYLYADARQVELPSCCAKKALVFLTSKFQKRASRCDTEIKSPLLSWN